MKKRPGGKLSKKTEAPPEKHKIIFNKPYELLTVFEKEILAELYKDNVLSGSKGKQSLIFLL
jgi:hypothetical protein